MRNSTPKLKTDVAGSVGLLLKYWIMTKTKEKRFLTFREMKRSYETMPPTKYLWSGIKEGSCGLVFGPSKSGKTIFCENMAMNIAIGKNNFFGYDLDGTPKKVLFVSLEEHWVNRVDRNVKQYMALTEEQQALIDENYRYQHINFPKHVTKPEDWDNLETTMADSEAAVVIVDSITRLTEGKIEGSDTAEKIMANLRDICHRLNVTLIAIHHTPKMNGKEITMDSIKGSAVFSQESDFAIAVNKSPTGKRYIKNVFFRYAADDDEDVREFTINNETIWLDYKGSTEEETLLPVDGRKNVDVREAITRYINKDTDTTYSAAELVTHFTSTLEIESRMCKTYLTELFENQKIGKIRRGVYASINNPRIGGENA
jgi:archaellum biogenesis ATPase FlaH